MKSNRNLPKCPDRFYLIFGVEVNVNSISLVPDPFDGFFGEKYPGGARISLRRGSKKSGKEQTAKKSNEIEQTTIFM